MRHFIRERSLTSGLCVVLKRVLPYQKSPARPNAATSAPHNHGLTGRIITSAIVLASNRPEVERDLGGLVHEFDAAWLEIQRAAYLFYSNSAALRRCGHRLYALQEQYYTAGRYDMAVAIDPILEAGRFLLQLIILSEITHLKISLIQLTHECQTSP
jgi:hypothetical protein